MKNLCTISAILIFSITLQAQETFIKTYGDSKMTEGIAILELDDGSFLMAGNLNDHNAYQNDIYLVKTNATGDTIYTRRIDLDTQYGFKNHAVHTLLPTSDGNYALSVMYQDSDPLLIKVNSSGDVLWYNNIQPLRSYKATSNQYGFGFDFRECPDEGFVFALGREIIKTDSLGNFEWKHHVTEVLYNTCFLYGIEISDQGVIAATGYSTQQNSGTNDDIYCIAVDMQGNLLWDVAYENQGHDHAFSVCENTGGFVLTAMDALPNSGNPDILLMKIDYVGNVIWNKNLNVEVGARPYNISSSADGSMMITGEEYLNNRTYAFLYKIDAEGEIVWNAYFQDDPGNEFHIGMEVIELADGGYAIVGTTSDSPNFSNMMLIRTDESGIVTSTNEMATPKILVASCSPNPFRNFTTISYTLQTDSQISFRVFNQQGALQFSKYLGAQHAGNQQITWNGTSWNGQTLSAGIYVYQIRESKNLLYSGKLILQ